MYTFSPQKQGNQVASMKNNNPLHVRYINETQDSKEFTMGGGHPLSSRNIDPKQLKSYTLGSSIPSPGLVEKRLQNIPNFSNIKYGLSGHSSKKNFSKKQRLECQYRNSQEIRIETLENIIYDKLQVINDLEDKLQKQRVHTQQSCDTGMEGETPRSIAFTEHSTQQFQHLQVQYEAQIKDANEKKKKYKDKARKYKTILKKRDNEMMDLVVESKELRSALEKEQRKHQETKNKLRHEIVVIKDDLQNQARKQQVEFTYDMEQLKREISEKDRKINESKFQIDNLKKEMERFKEISFQNQSQQLQSLRSEYEVQLRNKDDLLRHMEGEMENIRKQNNKLNEIEKELYTIQEQQLYYKEQNSCLKDKIEGYEEKIAEKEKTIKKLQSQNNKVKDINEDNEKELEKLQEENVTLVTKYKKEINQINEKHEEKLKEIEVEYQQKLGERDREILLAKGEILKLKEGHEETDTNSKKQMIKNERLIIEQENQIKSLNLVIEDLKGKEREKITVEQKVEGKNRQISLLKEQIDTLREELLMYKLNLGKENGVTNEELEAELIKLVHQNKQIKKELVELKYKNEDLLFKHTRGTQRSSYDKENRVLENSKSIRDHNILSSKHHFKNSRSHAN